MRKLKKIKNELIVGVISFVLGILLMYFANISWLEDNKNITDELISNFRANYDIQEKLKKNYSDAYEVARYVLMNCIVLKENCDGDKLAVDFDKVQTERADLDSQLEKSNKQIEETLNWFNEHVN